MDTDTNFSKSGFSPDNVGNGFAFSGGSPGVGSFTGYNFSKIVLTCANWSSFKIDGWAHNDSVLGRQASGLASITPSS